MYKNKFYITVKLNILQLAKFMRLILCVFNEKFIFITNEELKITEKKIIKTLIMNILDKVC